MAVMDKLVEEFAAHRFLKSNRDQYLLASEGYTFNRDYPKGELDDGYVGITATMKSDPGLYRFIDYIKLEQSNTENLYVKLT